MAAAIKCCCEGLFKTKRNKIVVLGLGDKSGATSVALQIYFQQRVTAVPSNTTERWTINYVKEPRITGPSPRAAAPELPPSCSASQPTPTSSLSTKSSRKNPRGSGGSEEEMGDVYASSYYARDESPSSPQFAGGIASPQAPFSQSQSNSTPASSINTAGGKRPARRRSAAASGHPKRKEKDVVVELVDVGRSDRLEGFCVLQPILEEAVGVVLVLDATKLITDKDRHWLHGVLTLAPKEAKVYVACNKQDMKGAQRPTQIAESLGLTAAAAAAEISSTLSNQYSHRPQVSILPDPEGTMWTCQPCVGVHKDLDSRAILDFVLDGDVRPMISMMEDISLDGGGGGTQQRLGEEDAEISNRGQRSNIVADNYRLTPSSSSRGSALNPSPTTLCGPPPVNSGPTILNTSSSSIVGAVGHSRLLTSPGHGRSVSQTSTVSRCSSTTATVSMLPTEGSLRGGGYNPTATSSSGQITPPPAPGMELEDIRVQPPFLGGLESGACTEDSVPHSLTEPSATPPSSGLDRGGLLHSSTPVKPGSSALSVMKRFRKEGGGTSSKARSSVVAPLEKTVGRGDDGESKNEASELLLDVGEGKPSAAGGQAKRVNTQYTMVQQQQQQQDVERRNGRGETGVAKVMMTQKNTTSALHSPAAASLLQVDFSRVLEEERENDDYYGGGGEEDSRCNTSRTMGNLLEGLPNGEAHRKRLAKLGLLGPSNKPSLLLSTPAAVPTLLSANSSLDFKGNESE